MEQERQLQPMYEIGDKVYYSSSNREGETQYPRYVGLIDIVVPPQHIHLLRKHIGKDEKEYNSAIAVLYERDRNWKDFPVYVVRVIAEWVPALGWFRAVSNKHEDQIIVCAESDLIGYKKQTKPKKGN